MRPMRKDVMALILILPSLISSFVPVQGTAIIYEQMDGSLEDITLQDDAFHGHENHPFIEWWYFDAKLDNGYTFVFGIQVINIFGKGMVTTRLTLYDDSDVIIKYDERYPLSALVASSHIPSIAIAGKQLIIGSYDAQNNSFLYTLTVEIPEGSFSLRFIGCTQGWKKQQQSGDWWAVILPRAHVTGSIFLGGNELSITGIGYHDHNWGINPLVVLRFGWLWGTCFSPHYTITWAEMRTTRLITHPVLVLNENDAGYLNIPSETIWFSSGNTQFDHLRRVPWFFNIEAMTQDVFLVVNMEVISVDYTTFFGFIGYWRYHVKYTGTIFKDGRMETIEGISLMEYIRFR